MATTPIAGLRYPTLTDDPNVPEDIQNLATDLDSRVVPRYASSALRDTAITSPTEGQLAYVTNTDSLQYYSGTAWRGFPQLIAESILTGTAGNVTFTGIPTIYNTLRLVMIGKSDTSAAFTAGNIQFNSDTGTNYDYTQQQAFGGSISSGESLDQTSLAIGEFTAATAVSGSVAMMDVLIPFYRGTTFWKPVTSSHMLMAQTAGGQTGQIYNKQWTGRWRSASAITSIVIFPSAGSFVAGSSFSLYGLS